MKKQPQKILCAIDFSESTDTILSYGIGMCQAYRAKLLLTHVVSDLHTLLHIHNQKTLDGGDLQQTNIEKAREKLATLGKGLDIDHELIVRQGDPEHEINGVVQEKNIDLVITSTHGNSGGKRLLIGSVTEKMMKTIRCPLLVLNHRCLSEQTKNPGIRLEKILVGCDFSPDSGFSFTYGLELAIKFQSKLYLAHVIRPKDYEKKHKDVDILRAQMKNKLQEMIPDPHKCRSLPKTVLLEGKPYKELLNFARYHEIDMLVLGIRGHTIWEKLTIGSTTDRVIRESPCPVLVVRHPVMEKAQNG